MVVTRDVKKNPSDRAMLTFHDYKLLEPKEYTIDQPQTFYYASFFSCRTTGDKTQLDCVVWDYGTEFISFTYAIDYKTHHLKLEKTFRYERYYQCEPLGIKLSGNFLGVYCNIGSSNTEKIFLYIKERRYIIYTFELQGESTDFFLSSFKPTAISLAIAGQKPKTYLIRDQSYLDSNTNDLEDLKGIDLILNNRVKSSIALSKLFTDNSKPPTPPKPKIFDLKWIIIASVIAIVVLAGILFVCFAFRGDRNKRGVGFYGSMESREDGDNTRRQTIRKPNDMDIRDSVITTNTDMKVGMSRSIIKGMYVNSRITESGFFDED